MLIRGSWGSVVYFGEFNCDVMLLERKCDLCSALEAHRGGRCCLGSCFLLHSFEKLVDFSEDVMVLTNQCDLSCSALGVWEVVAPVLILDYNVVCHGSTHKNIHI